MFSDIGVWLGEIGWWAYVVAPLVMTIVAVLPVPGEAPAIANGMIFGPFVGSMITWTCAMAGAWISYEIAHAWGRPLTERVVGESRLGKVGQVVSDAGWSGLLVLRLIPLVAFTALNWGAGLFVVPRWRFLWTTAAGITPGAIIFTSSGVGLEALYRRSPLVAVGLAVAVIGAMGPVGATQPPAPRWRLALFLRQPQSHFVGVALFLATETASCQVPIEAPPRFVPLGAVRVLRQCREGCGVLSRHPSLCDFLGELVVCDLFVFEDLFDGALGHVGCDAFRAQFG